MVEACVDSLIRAGDYFEISPAHNACVDGDERFELILFTPTGNGD